MTKSDYQQLIAHKLNAKKELFSKCKLGDHKLPMLLVYEPKQGEAKENFYQLLEGISVLPIYIIVLSDKEPGESFSCPTGKITWLNSDDGRMDDVIDEYLTAADMVLTFDEHKNDLKNLISKGIVIIGHDKSPMLENYHPNDETGNSFTFDSSSPWAVFRAVVRAHETYRFPYDWQNVIRYAYKKMSK